MFDIKNLKATPDVARRLITASKLNGMQISDDLKALAQQGVLTTHVDFADSPLQPSNSQIKAIQFVKDWAYRSAILYSGVEGKETALLTARHNAEYPILVLTRTEKFAEWAGFVSRVFPDKKVNVFPFTKANKDNIPANCNASLQCDEASEVYISNTATMMRSEVLDKVRFKFIVTDEYESVKSFGYNSTTGAGLLNEFKKVVMLQNISFLVQDKTDTNTLLNFAYMNRNNHHLAHLVQSVLQPENSLLLNLDFADDLVNKYYDRFSNDTMLQMFGISTHLVYDEERTSPVVNLRFFNDSIEKIRGLKENANGAKSTLRIHLQKEQEISRLARKPIKEVMEHFVDGGVNDYAMNELYTREWCDLKYKEIGRMFLSNYSNSSKRILFHATNPTLISTFTAHAPSIIHYETAKSRKDLMQKYISVDNDTMDFFHNESRFMMMGVNSMVNEEILKRTHYLVMAQYPSNVDDFARIIDVCNKYHITLVDVVLQGSFEEYLFDSLYRKLNI